MIKNTDTMLQACANGDQGLGSIDCRPGQYRRVLWSQPLAFICMINSARCVGAKKTANLTLAD